MRLARGDYRLIMRTTRIVGLASVTAIASLVFTCGTASAALVPIDPGPIGAGRPILGTTQNLPSLGSTDIYDAGPGFAEQITDYYTKGAALRDQTEVAKAAEKWARKYVTSKCGGDGKQCKAMVVFDIDETLVNNYEWDTAVENCTSPGIKPVVDFYKSLATLGIETAIVTGRPQSQRDETVTCLRKLGVSDWYELVTRTDKTEDLPASAFKAQQRAAWERKGFTIIASIGDQVSDMALGHTLRGFLLPDAMYYIP